MRSLRQLSLLVCMTLLFTGCGSKNTNVVIANAESADVSSLQTDQVSLNSDISVSDEIDAAASAPVLDDYGICTDMHVYDGEWHKYRSDLKSSDFRFMFTVDTEAYHGNSYILYGSKDDMGYACTMTQVSTDDGSSVHYGFEFLCMDLRSGFADRLMIIPADLIGRQLADIIPAYARDIAGSDMRDWRKAEYAAEFIDVLSQICDEPDVISAESMIFEKLQTACIKYDRAFDLKSKQRSLAAIDRYSLHMTRSGDELVFSATDDLNKGYRFVMNDAAGTCHITAAVNVISETGPSVIADQDLSMTSEEFDEIMSLLRLFFETDMSSDASFDEKSRVGALVLSSVYAAYLDKLNDDIVSVMGDENWDQAADLNNDQMLSQKEFRIKRIGDLIDMLISDLDNSSLR